MLIGLFNQLFRSRALPKASEVLRCHLRQRGYPPWTSYFLAQRDCLNDQFGQSHFEFDVDGRNYHILRTGCFPFLKYHCTQRATRSDLSFENRLYTLFKCLNLGLPTLLYGLAAIFLIRHSELVQTDRHGSIRIYFLLKEQSGASF